MSWFSRPGRSLGKADVTAVARAAVAFTSEQNAVRCLPAHRICEPSEIGQLTAEVFHLLDLQPCWLLQVLPSTASAEGEPSLFGCFIGLIPSSDFSSACMLIVRLLPA